MHTHTTTQRNPSEMETSREESALISFGLKYVDARKMPASANVSSNRDKGEEGGKKRKKKKEKKKEEEEEARRRKEADRERQREREKGRGPSGCAAFQCHSRPHRQPAGRRGKNLKVSPSDLCAHSKCEDAEN